MKKSIFFICIVCLFCNSCLFQGEITTIVEGIVVDDSTNLPVEGVELIFSFTKDVGFPPKSKPVYDERIFTNNEGRYKISKTFKRGEIDDVINGIDPSKLGYDDFVSNQQVGSRISIGDRNEVNFRLLKR